MSANVDGMVRSAVESYRAGNKAEARQLLERALEIDEYNEKAWLWLSAVVETKEEQQTCLENVLIINPNNDRAKQGLRSLGVDPDALIAESAPEPEPDAGFSNEGFSDADFLDDGAASAAEDDAYYVPTSSSSAEHRGDDLTSDDYDQWMSQLDLGTGNAESAAPPQDTYDDGYEDAGYGDMANSLFGGEVDYDEYDSYENTDYADDGVDVFLDDLDEGADVDLRASYADTEAFSDALNEGIYDADHADLFDERPQPQAEEDYGPDPSELFVLIPPEIEITRLPGEVETIPASVHVITGVLAVANIGAVIFLILQLV